MKKFFTAIIIFFMASIGIVQAQRDENFHKNYKLDGVVVLSRHNIRSPIADKNSVLAKITPHDWFNWTSARSELSMLGGESEVIMGQYFRKWLAAENLITENYLPTEGEIRFYTNIRQRTIATAQFFSSGMLPVANVRIEHKPMIGEMDPVFNPRITFISDKFIEIASAQMNKKLNLAAHDESYRMLEKVLDFKKSEYAKSHGISNFDKNDFTWTPQLNKEPSISKGLVDIAWTASDALSLQYYEEKNPVKAAFGHKLTFDDWKKLVALKDYYMSAIYSAPIVAINIAHPLLQVMSDEISLNRKFTFLCGHDSNILTVLGALDVKDYSLPETIETKVPIGAKLVICKWRGNDNQEYATLDLIYASSEQLRNKTTLTLENPPQIYSIKLNGLRENSDGVYRLEDLQARFKQAIEAYDNLPK